MSETIKSTEQPWIIKVLPGVIVPEYLVVQRYADGCVDVRIPTKQLPGWKKTEDGKTKLVMVQRPREDFL